MSTNPLVSIIIPCYNYGHFLGETLENVLQQTYLNIECIIVDDGSIDNTKEIAQRFIEKDFRFRYIHQINKGTSSAKNKGISIANGQFIQFLDADDLLNKEKIESQVTYLQHNPKVDIIYGSVLYFDTNDHTRLSKSLDMEDKNWMPMISGRDEVVLSALIVNNIMVISAPLIRREVFKSVGLFNEELKGCEDWDLWIRCALAGCYFHFDGGENQFTFIRTHIQSASMNNLTMNVSEYQMRKDLQSRSNIPTALHSLNKQLLLKSAESRAYAMIESGYIKTGFKEIFNLIFTNRRPYYYIRNAVYYLRKKVMQSLRFI